MAPAQLELGLAAQAPGAAARPGHVHVMRYMGNKAPLLPFLLPVLEDLAAPGQPVLDLMAGTCAVGYAMKPRHPVWCNDVQAYSHVIGLALVENGGRRVTARRAREVLSPSFDPPGPLCEPSGGTAPGFFETTYADTYFSRAQCREIDGLRSAIEAVPDPYERALYLTALIHAMCYAQSTPGHFAQFLPPDHPRVGYLRALSIRDAFLDKCDDLARLTPSPYPCRATRGTWEDALDGRLAPGPRVLDPDALRLVYVDPPYSQEQYSRFYHLLDTMVLGDRPAVEHKARYRVDRFKSDFCYRSRARRAFEGLFAAVAAACPRASLAVSYGSRGLVPLDDLVVLLRRHFRRVAVHRRPHAHSSLGKGAAPVEEYLLAATR